MWISYAYVWRVAIGAYTIDLLCHCVQKNRTIVCINLYIIIFFLLRSVGFNFARYDKSSTTFSCAQTFCCLIVCSLHTRAHIFTTDYRLRLLITNSQENENDRVRLLSFYFRVFFFAHIQSLKSSIVFDSNNFKSFNLVLCLPLAVAEHWRDLFDFVPQEFYRSLPLFD